LDRTVGGDFSDDQKPRLQHQRQLAGNREIQWRLSLENKVMVAIIFPQ
jgi:hypothetical protein